LGIKENKEIAMSKLTLEELHEIRERESDRLKKREIHGKTCHIVVAMGTIGIEAGAKVVLNKLVDEVEAHNLDNVLVTQTGIVKDKENAPVVEVYTPALGAVAYGKVDAKLASRIISEHVIGGKVIEDHRIELEA
jgi:Ferredoxin